MTELPTIILSRASSGIIHLVNAGGGPLDGPLDMFRSLCGYQLGEREHRETEGLAATCGRCNRIVNWTGDAVTCGRCGVLVDRRGDQPLDWQFAEVTDSMQADHWLCARCSYA